MISQFKTSGIKIQKPRRIAVERQNGRAIEKAGTERIG